MSRLIITKRKILKTGKSNCRRSYVEAYLKFFVLYRLCIINAHNITSQHVKKTFILRKLIFIILTDMLYI